MGKNKLKHFEENKTFPMFIQPTIDEVKSGFYLQGKWSEKLFNNYNPIVIELACGKGEYTVGLARRNHNCNFIGIDRKGARMWRGMKTAVEEKMPNVAFLRTRIDFLGQIFGKHEVSEIWITFPDPQLKNKKSQRRLTSSYFIDIYKNILTPDGKVHLKTDNPELYQFTLDTLRELHHEIIFETEDLYGSTIKSEATDIQTHYEMTYLKQSQKIKYIVFKFNVVVQ